MDSKDTSSETKLSSVGTMDEHGGQKNSQLLCKDSQIFGSKPKIQLLELAENIQAAETQYDSIKMQWDYVKSIRNLPGPVYKGSTLSQNSASRTSLNSLKQASSGHSVQREPEPTEEAFPKVRSNEQLQEVLPPGNPEIVFEEEEDVNRDLEILLANLNLKKNNSNRSIRTSARKPKKGTKPRKRSLSRSYNDDGDHKNPLFGKSKKKKLRMKTSNSKSTVATRETNVPDKKKKLRKQKSADAMSSFKSPQTRKKPSKARESELSNSKEFVEIYHNSTLKNGSASIYSSNEKAADASSITRLQQESDLATGDSENKNNDYIDLQDYDNLPCFDLDSADQEKNDVDVDPDADVDEDGDPVEAQLCGHAGHHHHHHHNCAGGQNMQDFLSLRNYEMPTMSSRMKRTHRSYFHRYNVRNIPFIVSTSVSPSHNLGLNIQQILSIIKTRQSTIPGVSPVLIRKISQGVRPVSTLFEQIGPNTPGTTGPNNPGDPYTTSNRNLNNETRSSQDVYWTESKPSQFSYKQPSLTYEPLYEVDEETCSDKASFDGAKPDNKASRKSCQVEKSKKKQKRFSDLCGGEQPGHQAGDNNYPSNNKEISEVFTRLYDQFDKMITQHDKLKEQSEKRRNDKTLVREITELEEAIHTKEQEITAVVNLYKEVMSLKHQMKRLNDRNSLVCITTEESGFFGNGSKVCPSHSKTGTQKSGIVHETPNALKLAGLLKQIQAFQRQISVF